MRMLVEFGVAKKFVENHRIASKCGSWMDVDERLGESFEDKEAFVTRTKAPKCTGDKKTIHFCEDRQVCGWRSITNF